MSGLDVAYVAGVLDSRVHIEPDRARLTVTTKRITLIEWLAKQTGVQAATAQRDYAKRGCSEHCEEKHQHIVTQSPYWTVRGTRAVVVLYNVLPWLVYARDEARQTLRAAKDTWPVDVSKNEVGAAMRRLGWELPSRDDL